MAAYQEVTVKARFSDSSAFSPVLPGGLFEPTAYNPGSGTYRYEVRIVTAATGGTTIELGMYTTVTNIIVVNLDATNYVEATFRTSGGGGNNQVLRAVAGMPIMTGLVTVANDLVLTANTAAVKCAVLITGT